MRKTYVLPVLMLLMVVTLTACTSNTDMQKENLDNKENVENLVDKENTWDEIEDRNEYSFKVSINWADGFDMILKIYKKWENSLTEIVKMFGDEWDDMPFNIKKMLKVDGNTYQQIEKDEETVWFSIPGMDSEDDMFNLREMSQIDESVVIDQQNEVIDWEDLTCYYVDDEISWEGKTCLDWDVFAYGEYSENWVKDIIKIEDFDDSVKDKIFTAPDEEEILTTQEMMQLFQ